MKAVILAGGLGSRLSEETENKPKPMVEIGGKPILWHIMKIYSSHGINDFIICCGYKGYVIKEYFNNYFLHMSDVTFNMKQNTMTGGRLKRIKKYIKNEKAFCFTYGDGVADINISKLISFHKKNQKLATLTATRPPARYGAIKFGHKNQIKKFEEKPDGDGNWINGGFFVLDPKVIDEIKNDKTSWELEPLANLAKKGQLFAYKHNGFWMAMDTLRDKIELNNLCYSGKAPWMTW